MVRAAVEEGLLVKGGGHAMAAGLTVERSQLGPLRAFFEARAERVVQTLVDSQVLKIDGALSASGATLGLIDLLERAGPMVRAIPSRSSPCRPTASAMPAPSAPSMSR